MKINSIGQTAFQAKVTTYNGLIIWNGEGSLSALSEKQMRELRNSAEGIGRPDDEIILYKPGPVAKYNLIDPLYPWQRLRGGITPPPACFQECVEFIEKVRCLYNERAGK
jgi:hypothetical protein